MSIRPRDQRTLAFQALFLLDAHEGAEDAEASLALIETLAGAANDLEIMAKPADLESALALANGAYDNRRAADAAFMELAPEWPSQRQPAVDRAILRLAHHEMTTGLTNPKIAVNEAVELAKRFSTDRSPSFVNALLDKILKRVLADLAPADAAPADTAPAAADDGGGTPA